MAGLLVIVIILGCVIYQYMKATFLKSLSMFIIAVCAILVVSNTASGDTLLKKAQLKHEMKINKEHAETYNIKETGEKNKLDIVKLLYIFLMGVVAISAMILPGVSGSFLLLLMGGYFVILKAIVNRDFPVLVSFTVGCLIGIIAFSRFLNFLLKKWHDQTMSFLLGLVIGSLWMIWPFKTSAKVGEEVIYLINRIPTSFSANEIYTILAAIIGVVIVITLLLVEAKKEKIRPHI